MKCFQCSSANPAQAYCGNCGSPLDLAAFIRNRVDVELQQKTQMRDLVERESAVRIFEKAYGWAKMAAGVAVVVVLPLAAIGIYKWSDLFSTINSAKQNVSRSAADAEKAVLNVATRERRAIESASTESQRNLLQISSESTREGKAVVESALSARRQIAHETLQAQNAIEGLQEQLQTASKLQPEMLSIRDELTRHQKVLSSSQEFVRDIFKSHHTEYFDATRSPSARYRILPRKNGQGATVYILLDQTPIAETLDLQFHIYSQPHGSYIAIHNLVVFSWGDPDANLKTHPLVATYFPDDLDHEAIKSLSEEAGRIYADGEPLPRFGEVDASFVGNKWTNVVNNPAK